MTTRRRTPARNLSSRRGQRWLGTLLLALCAVTTVAIRAQVSAPAAGAPPNFDIRTYKEDPRTADDSAAADFLAKLPPAGPAARAVAEARLDLLARLTATSGVAVDVNPALQTTETVTARPGGAFLTPPSSNRVAALRGFLAAYAPAYGITAGDAESLAVVADYANPAGNMAWVELEQRINGIPVFQGQIRGGFTAKGELVRTTGLLVATSAAPALDAPAIDGAQAVALAAERLNLTIASGDLSAKASDGDGTSITFNGTAVANDIKAWQVYFPLADGTLRLAWVTQIMSSPDAFMTIIDGATGATLFRKNLTNYQTQAATYNVYNAESPAPAAPTPALPGANYQAPLVARQSFTLIGNEAPNTFNNLGWITDGANAGNGFTDGNNVEAGIDIDGINGVDAPVAGTARVFNFAYNPSPGSPAPGDAPSLPAFRNGEVTNMFFWTNRFHDELYRLGFTEAARNFQNDNFGRGGVAADRISAEAQDSAGTNNANFSTPADGGRGRMQMFIFPNPNADRSSGLDQTVLLHELTHGLSNRLHNNGSGLTTGMAGGMGEGWGDFYARALTSTSSEPVGGVFTTGGWITQLLTAGFTDNYYSGIRRFPYAVKTTVGSNGRPHNPLTFGDIDPSKINLTDGAYPPSLTFVSATASEVHNVGEVWTMLLLEVRARLITRLGFTAGNTRAMQIVTDGMKLDPINPTFVQARDAIVAAAAAGPDPTATVADVWAGFAARGLGALAVVNNATTFSVTESFLTPSDPVPTFSVADASVFEGNAGTAMMAFTVSLANPSATEHRVSYATADGTAQSFGTPYTAAVATTIPAGAPGTTQGASAPYPIPLNIAGVTGPIQHLAVRLNGLTHTFPADLDVLLVGPGGQKVMVLSDVGGGGDVTGVDLTFEDGAPAPSATQLVTGTFAPTDVSPGDVMNAPAPAGPYGTALSVFDGTDPNGTWSLYVMDDASGDVGSLAGFTLLMNTAGTSSDYVSTSGQLVFPPGTTTQTVNVTVNGDVTPEAHETLFLNLSSPINSVIGDGQAVGTILNDDAGGSAPPPTAAPDAYTGYLNTPLTVLAPGVLANDTTPSGSMTAQLVGNPTHGAVTLAADGGFVYTPTAGYTGADGFVYRAVGTNGPGNTVTVSLTVLSTPLTIQPATNLRVTSIVGNAVTFRWTPPAAGPVATSYVFEGGLSPGEVLVSIPLGAVPTFTLPSPSVSYFARIHALSGATRSAASNEVNVHVNTPVPPSAPAALLGTVAGSSVSLAWTPTFGGAAPTGYVLDVTGAAVVSIPLGLGDNFSAGGVAPGTYTVSLRATNAAGSSGPSNPLTLTIPIACSGAPLPPTNFLGFSAGGVVSLAWDTATSGPAPTSFVLGVTGAFVGNVPVAGRALSAPVPPGSYVISVQAVNACGASAFTAAQTVTVP